jgi:hypothetical protein
MAFVEIVALLAILSFDSISCQFNETSNQNQTLQKLNRNETLHIKESIGKALDINLNITITALVVCLLIIGISVGFILGGSCGVCLGLALSSNYGESRPKRKPTAIRTRSHEDMLGLHRVSKNQNKKEFSSNEAFTGEAAKPKTEQIRSFESLQNQSNANPAPPGFRL